jgi:hypothetical protein
MANLVSVGIWPIGNAMDNNMLFVSNIYEREIMHGARFDVI